jgi:hypothetical protein
MEDCLRMLQRSQAVLATGDEKGVTAELRFGSRTSLVQLQTDSEHSLLGNGLRVLLSLPLGAAGQLAAELDGVDLSGVLPERRLAGGPGRPAPARHARPREVGSRVGPGGEGEVTRG